MVRCPNLLTLKPRYVLIFVVRILSLICLLSLSLRAQVPPVGRFLTDSIQIGRPFQYALVYRHQPTEEVLFPDTAIHFAPYQVRQVTTFPTTTTGTLPDIISRDSAVYTLISFETTSAQVLQVPIRIVRDADCTLIMTQPDTIFLRTSIAANAADTTGVASTTLATHTELIQLRQQFNYPILVAVVTGLSMLLGLLYLLFGRWISRKIRLYQLYLRHMRFQRNYNQLIRTLNAETATTTTSQAIVIWKEYLGRLEGQSFASLTTTEIAERIADERVVDALREADRVIYGGAFSVQSQPALRLLRDVATQTYRRQRAALLASTSSKHSDGPTDSSSPTASTQLSVPS
ncbi:hypothetical protein BN8_06557 [Fibrisoma limi BUZ 3]|uniref:DUF4129 domain-containing protein n=1 Tax=Fibrisoma limi BUZ 3 TaxID=1185876 RepID=I2GTC4_9BACT|nr:hypothetical protein BN8_06557 [Fibrisoma limi BUZ 3]